LIRGRKKKGTKRCLSNGSKGRRKTIDDSAQGEEENPFKTPNLRGKGPLLLTSGWGRGKKRKKVVQDKRRGKRSK